MIRESSQPATQALPFDFTVDDRLKKRAIFDQRIQEKIEEEERFRFELEEEAKRLEALEIKEMRKGMMPEIHPMPDFEPPSQTQKSRLPLTVP